MTAEPPAGESRDASEVGSRVAQASWAEAARPVLLEAAGRYRAVVTHRQLGTAVQERTGITTSRPMHQWLPEVLSRVADQCQALGEPLLSSLCVTAQGSVGAAYADAVQRVRGAPPADPDEHAAVERLECYRHWEAAGLPADRGTPLRTAHFTPVRKAPARPSTPRAAAPRKAPAARRSTTTAAAPAPAPVRLCPRCFTQVPASGVCDYCD